MSETINFTRLTTSDRIPDRFLTCQAYSPVDLEQAQAGIIFSQIEILNPWFPTSQIGQTVINTLIREYYRAGNTSDLVNFENAIKKVNEALAQIAQGGETDWIGKFNGVLALVCGREIHLAQTGASEAYLYRGERINHITEGLRGEEAPHPLKTFTNLTSGTLQKDDKIVIASPDFIKAISADDLKTIVISFRPTVAATEAAKVLKSQNTQSGNAIFMELTTKEELAGIPPEQKLGVIYLDQPMFSLSGFVRDIWNRAIMPAALWLYRHSSSALSKGRETLAPKVKRGVASARVKVGKAAQSALAKTRETKDKLSRQATQKTIPETAKVKTERETKSVPLKATRKLLFKLKSKLRRFLIKINLYSKKKSKMALVLAVLAVVVLTATLAFSLSARGKKIERKSFENKLSTISSLETDASLAGSQGKDEEAVGLYREIAKLAEEIKKTDVKEKALQKIKEICQIKDAVLATEIEVAEPLELIAKMGEDIYGISPSGKIYLRRADDSSFSLFEELNTQGKNFKGAWGVERTNKLVLLSGKSSLFTFDIRSKKLEEEPAELSGTGPLDSFGENLYLLNPASGQITRINFINANYSTVVPYLKSDNSAKGAVDMAIDGTVYTISQNGKITSFSRGAVSDEFELALPAKERLSGYKTISTNADASTVIIFERSASRIIETSKRGEFISQFDLPNLPEDGEIFIDPAERSIVATKDKKVLFYSLP